MVSTDDYPIYCHAQTYAQTRDSPAEHCTEEVAQEGDLCDRHDEDDRADELYDAYLDAKYEREHDPDYYRTFGD